MLGVGVFCSESACLHLSDAAYVRVGANGPVNTYQADQLRNRVSEATW